jgi:hypothetical protein
LDAVVVQRRVVAEDRHSLGEALADKEPVERVAMMDWKSCDDLEMAGCYREYFHVMRRRIVVATS